MQLPDSAPGAILTYSRDVPPTELTSDPGSGLFHWAPQSFQLALHLAHLVAMLQQCLHAVAGPVGALHALPTILTPEHTHGDTSAPNLSIDTRTPSQSVCTYYPTLKCMYSAGLAVKASLINIFDSNWCEKLPARPPNVTSVSHPGVSSRLLSSAIE